MSRLSRSPHGSVKAFFATLPVGKWVPLPEHLTLRTMRSCASRYKTGRVATEPDSSGKIYVFNLPPVPEKTAAAGL